MALVIPLLSSIGAMLVALIAFFGFGVSLTRAVVLYLTCASLPAVLHLSISFLHMPLYGEAEDHY